MPLVSKFHYISYITGGQSIIVTRIKKTCGSVLDVPKTHIYKPWCDDL